MKLNRIHAAIGFLLVIVPLLGFGREFKYGFSVLAGGVILYFALSSIHTEMRKKHHRRPHRHDTFVENKPKKEEPAYPESPHEHIAAEPMPTQESAPPISEHEEINPGQ